MGLKEDLARAKSSRPAPVLVDIVVGETLYKVEVRRLDGMEWAAVMASAPPIDEGSARLGFNARVGALVACRDYGRLLDADGNEIHNLGIDDYGEIVPLDWAAILDAISGVELQALSATWWALNSYDPNQRVVELKKASQGGGRTK